MPVLIIQKLSYVSSQALSPSCEVAKTSRRNSMTLKIRTYTTPPNKRLVWIQRCRRYSSRFAFDANCNLRKCSRRFIINSSPITIIIIPKRNTWLLSMNTTLNGTMGIRKRRMSIGRWDWRQLDPALIEAAWFAGKTVRTRNSPPKDWPLLLGNGSE